VSARAGEKYLNAVPQDADWERRALEIDKRFEPTSRATNSGTAADDDVRRRAMRSSTIFVASCADFAYVCLVLYLQATDGTAIVKRGRRGAISCEPVDDDGVSCFISSYLRCVARKCAILRRVSVVFFFCFAACCSLFLELLFF
jgi:hypothetical protein